MRDIPKNAEALGANCAICGLITNIGRKLGCIEVKAIIQMPVIPICLESQIFIIHSPDQVDIVIGRIPTMGQGGVLGREDQDILITDASDGRTFPHASQVLITWHLQLPSKSPAI